MGIVNQDNKINFKHELGIFFVKNIDKTVFYFKINSFNFK